MPVTNPPSGRNDEPDLAATDEELVLRELMEIAGAMPRAEELERRRARMTAPQPTILGATLAKIADDVRGGGGQHGG